MEDFLFKIFAASVGGGILVGVVALIKMRRLYLLRPRKFIYSNLGETGQIIELAILNYSLKTEDDITINLNPNFNYRMIAYNNGDVTIDETTIKIPRLSSEDEVTMIFLADSEGREFTDSDIISASSKEVKAKIIEKIEELIPPTKKTAQFASALTVILIAVAGFLWFVTHSIDSISSTVDKLGEKYPSWEITSYYSGSKFEEFYQDGKLPARIVNISRKGKYATIEIEYINKTDSIVHFRTDFSGPGINESYELSSLLIKNSRISRKKKLLLPFKHEKIDMAIQITAKHKGTYYEFTKGISIQ